MNAVAIRLLAAADTCHTLGWVAVGGWRGIFVETAKADFNELHRALVGES